MRKPFDALIEGLELCNSRGDWTSVALFLEGVATLEPDLYRFFLAA